MLVKTVLLLLAGHAAASRGSSLEQVPGLLRFGGDMKAFPHEQSLSSSKALTSPPTSLPPDECHPAVRVSKTVLRHAETFSVSVEYTMSSSSSSLCSPASNDWLGFYCADSHVALNEVPDAGFFDWAAVPSDCSPFDLSMNSGRYPHCEFRLFRSGVRLASSEALRITDATSVITHKHLATTATNSEMRVQWTQASQAPERGVPVRYWNAFAPNVVESVAYSASCATYTHSDMCAAPATSEMGFVNPGFLCSAVMTNLRPDTLYEYAIDKDLEHVAFRSNPKVGLGHKPFSFLVYGDMGTWRYEGSYDTVDVVVSEIVKPKAFETRMIHHFGDISYARGVSSTWDLWFDMIEIFSKTTPLLISCGNHEYDYLSGGENDLSGVHSAFSPSWWNGENDSGGECGVPTHHRFEMPANGNSLYWYSFDYASVHTVMLSSEHDCSPGSPQYEWLAANLAAVDRSVTPWVIVELHRPMYNNEAYESDYDVAVGIQAEFEDLLVENYVDLVLAGHYHSYLRSSRIYKDQRDDEKGVYHFTIGSSGASLDDITLYEKDWVEVFKMEFGVGKITVFNETHLYWEFIESKINEVTDSFWITKR